MVDRVIKIRRIEYRKTSRITICYGWFQNYQIRGWTSHIKSAFNRYEPYREKKKNRVPSGSLNICYNIQCGRFVLLPIHGSVARDKSNVTNHTSDLVEVGFGFVSLGYCLGKLGILSVFLMPEAGVCKFFSVKDKYFKLGRPKGY